MFRVTAAYIYIMLETDDREGERWQNAIADLAFGDRNVYEQHICSGFLIITCRTVGKPVRVSISSQGESPIPATLIATKIWVG